MGKQYNKVIKRRRRLAYNERMKEKAKESAISRPKPRRVPSAKKPAAPAPVAPAPAPVEESPVETTASAAATSAE